MFMAVCEFTYRSQEIVKAMSEETYKEFRAEYSAYELPEDKTKLYHISKHIVDEADLEILNKYKLSCELSRMKGVRHPHHPSNMVTENFYLSVAGVGLLQIDTVEVHENLCTHELQDYLDKGWRIVAVCPPNDSRRPTYILGMSSVMHNSK